MLSTMINNQSSKIKNQKLLVVVFFSGLVTLAVELSAFRLFAPVFGASNLISAVVIGLILLYLAAGYFLGGRWADRSPRAATLYRIITWGAFLVGLIPFIAQPLLRLTRDNLQNLAHLDAALLIFAFVVTLILFAVPITLLGCVSPFALRLSMPSVEHAGRTAGRLYAVSTLGSFIGSFLPELVLLNLVGTRGTFVVLALALIAIGLIGLNRQARPLLWMPIVLIALHALLPTSLSNLAGTLYQDESSYNYIQVVERNQTRYLLLNDGQGVHSIYTPGTIQTNGTWDYFTIAPYFNAPPTSVQRVALVGLAGGTLARSFTELYGPIPIDGLEIDPKIVAVGRAYFGMTQPNLNVLIGDGRAAFYRLPYAYSIIGLDAFRVPYIPWHLTTREYLQELRNHLTSDGVLVANVGRTRTDYSMVDAMARTASTVFASVHVIDVAGSLNSIVYATMQPTTLENLRANLAVMRHPLLTTTAQLALQHARPLNPEAVVFTDDNAPVERLTNGLMLNFLFGLTGGD
jgi:spermidine synthase